MAAKSEFDSGALVGQHFGAGSSCMVAEFVVEKNRFSDFRAATQNIPDTIAVFMTLQPFKVGEATCCDHDDVRVQIIYGIVLGAYRESDIHVVMTDFLAEPVRNPDDFAAPCGRCCQDDLPAEAVIRFEKNDFMTA